MSGFPHYQHDCSTTASALTENRKRREQLAFTTREKRTKCQRTTEKKIVSEFPDDLDESFHQGHLKRQFEDHQNDPMLMNKQNISGIQRKQFTILDAHKKLRFPYVSSNVGVFDDDYNSGYFKEHKSKHDMPAFQKVPDTTYLYEELVKDLDTSDIVEEREVNLNDACVDYQNTSLTVTEDIDIMEQLFEDEFKDLKSEALNTFTGSDTIDSTIAAQTKQKHKSMFEDTTGNCNNNKAGNVNRAFHLKDKCGEMEVKTNTSNDGENDSNATKSMSAVNDNKSPKWLTARKPNRRIFEFSFTDTTADKPLTSENVCIQQELNSGQTNITEMKTNDSGNNNDTTYNVRELGICGEKHANEINCDTLNEVTASAEVAVKNCPREELTPSSKLVSTANNADVVIYHDGNSEHAQVVPDCEYDGTNQECEVIGPSQTTIDYNIRTTGKLFAPIFNVIESGNIGVKYNKTPPQQCLFNEATNCTTYSRIISCTTNIIGEDNDDISAAYKHDDNQENKSLESCNSDIIPCSQDVKHQSTHFHLKLKCSKISSVDLDTYTKVETKLSPTLENKLLNNSTFTSTHANTFDDLSDDIISPSPVLKSMKNTPKRPAIHMLKTSNTLPVRDINKAEIVNNGNTTNTTVTVDCDESSKIHSRVHKHSVQHTWGPEHTHLFSTTVAGAKHKELGIISVLNISQATNERNGSEEIAHTTDKNSSQFSEEVIPPSQESDDEGTYIYGRVISSKNCTS